jgi:hypothetical protein
MLATWTRSSARVGKPAWMMPCGISMAESLSEVCLVISRRCDNTITEAPILSRSIWAMMFAAMMVLPLPVGAP